MTFCDECGDESAVYILRDGELHCVRHGDRVPEEVVSHEG